MSSTITSSAKSTSTSTSIVFHTTTVPSALDDLNSSEEVIDDTDPSIVYTGSWTLALTDDGLPSKTSHSTLVPGSSLVLTFTGTGVDVLGLTHIGGTVIEMTYSIDGAGAQSASVSGAQIGIADQTYISVNGLENKQHTLEITVGSGAGPRLFSIDCFVVTNAGASSASSSTTSGAAAALTSGTTSATTTAISGSNSNMSSPLSSSPTSGQSVSPSSSTPGLDLSSILTSSSATGAAASAESSPVDPNASVQLSAASHHGMSAGQITGTVIGTLLGFILIIALLLTLCRLRAIKKRKLPANVETTPSPLFTSSSDAHSERGYRTEKNYDLEELSPPQYEFVVHEHSGFPYHRTV
ncbi:hypothetical protein SCHPADRAFT_898754 [Schizopora paradoxa]|uniref:Uncharacterized protein n=1 Tax=Schizopora paradoxa TaxID=27342 RepID=A0A0H2S5G2_9AGAM|nr:hypothetical protein SCHPADRAFT_898754 [Schizopora paradoxa]